MFLFPMLLQPNLVPFNNQDYLHEIKYNGIRAIYTKNSEGHEELFTRHQTNITKKYPDILNLQEIPPLTVLDGELVHFQTNADGSQRDNFSRIMERFRYSNTDKIQMATQTTPATYMIFDVMYWNGIPMVDKPLIERKKLLFKQFQERENARLVSYRLGEGISLFKEVEEAELEGITSKRLNSPYRVGKRSSKGEWYKIINWTYVKAYITGYRKNQFGILCSVMDNPQQRIGVVEFGMGPEQKQAFYRISQQLITGEDKNYVYIQPILQCMIKGRGFTDKNYLFTPVFVDFIL